MSCFPGPYSCHKPSPEERPEGLVHVHERTWRQLSILISKDANANVGSGSYLHKGRWEPFAVLENSLENSDVPPTPVSLGPGGERGIARGLQQLGVTGQVLPATGGISPSDQDLNTSPDVEKGKLTS